MSKLTPDPFYMRPSEKLRLKVDFTTYADLAVDAGDTLTGTPTVSGTGLTLGTASVNATAFTNAKGGTCAVGHGVLFDCTAPSTAGNYEVLIEATTTAGQQPKAVIPIYVRSA